MHPSTSEQDGEVAIRGRLLLSANCLMEHSNRGLVQGRVLLFATQQLVCLLLSVIVTVTQSSR